MKKGWVIVNKQGEWLSEQSTDFYPVFFSRRAARALLADHPEIKDVKIKRVDMELHKNATEGE